MIMGLKQFRIVFTHPGSSVFANQTLCGKVILELNEDKVINSLDISCSGKGKVQWKESQSGSCGSSVVPGHKKINSYGRKSESQDEELETEKKTTGMSVLNSQTIMSVEESYIQERIILLEKKNCDDQLFLEKGCHEYPFEFQIPSSSPSSFQGPYGDVKYYIEAKLSRPKRKKNHVIKIPFTVNGVLDLNKDPRLTNLRTPSTDTYVTELKKLSKGRTNFLSCLICWVNKGTSLNQVGFHLRLHKSLFVPGEYIQFGADMRNMSPTDVSGVTLSLIQETNYYVGDKCRSGLKHTVATAKGPSVASGQQEIWETNPTDSLFLQIPAVPPTNLGSSQIIEVKYFLQLEMEFYGQKNIKGQLPILIGSIPLRSVFKDFVNLKKRNEPEVHSNNKGISKKAFGVSLGYPDLPSPTFEEAVCFTPSLDFGSFLIGNGLNTGIHATKPYVEKIQVQSSTTNEKEDEKDELEDQTNCTDEDSDDEYLNLRVYEKNKKYDDKYVPLYAKYTTIYAIDA